MKNRSQKNIAWCNNEWRYTCKSTVPLADRGLQLGDGIFETILILEGKPQLLNAHLRRWEQSALLLGMAPPPSINWLEPLIHEAIKKTKLEKGTGALRLNWTSGDYINRSLMPANEQKKQESHRFWMELNATESSFNPVKAFISLHEKRNAESIISLCKTFSYTQSIQARREARVAGYDEALLMSTNGTICCGATANLFVKRENKWLTPDLESGCLPGIMREQGLKKKLVEEAHIKPKPEVNDQWLLINSLGCRPISQVNNISLNIFSKPDALWHSLIHD